MRSILLVPLLLLLVGGCYLSYPALPRSRLLKPVPGATAEIPRDAGSVVEACGTNDSGSCKGKLSRRIRVVTGDPKYDGKAVTHYQFRMLVDEDFRNKVAHIRKLKSTCNISIAPTILAGAALVAALYIGNEKGENYTRDSFIAIGVGAGFYALSYPLGGHACMRASREWDATGMDTLADEKFVAVSEAKDEVYLEELQMLAEKFNADFGRTGATPESEIIDSSTTPRSQPTVAAGTKNIVDALKAQGGYLAFLTIVACAGKEAELASGNFTVLAFDDAAARKRLKSQKDRDRFKDNCGEIYNAHVATGGLPAASFQVGKMLQLDTLDGTSHGMRVREGHRVLEATNGIVYTLDEVLWR